MKTLWLPIAVLLLAVACAPPATPATFADRFAGVDKHLTRDEVAAVLGPADSVKNEKFPEGHFMGPQAGMIGIIGPGQPYERWEYVESGEVFQIYFAGEDEDDPENLWMVVGKTSFPQGAVF